MKKNIHTILEELYESFPSLKQQEEKIIPFIEAFLKTNVHVVPNNEFKNRLKKELLQKILISSSKNQNNFWQNLKIISSVFATGLAAYGVFSFYHLQIRPLSDNAIVSQVQEESFKSDVSSLKSQDSDIPSVTDSSGEDFNKREPSEINTLQSVPFSGDSKQPLISPSIQEGLQGSIIAPQNIPLNENITDTPSKKQDTNIPLLPSSTNSENQIVPSNGFAPLLRVNSSGENSSSEGSGFFSFEEDKSGEEGENTPLLLKSHPIENSMMSDMLSLEPIDTVGSNHSPEQFTFKIIGNGGERKNVDTIFQSKNIRFSSSEYTVSVDSLDNGIFIRTNKQKQNGATVTIDAEDIPSPDLITQKFSSLLQKVGVKNENLKLDSFEVSKKLSQVFDENITFYIPYTILGKEVYDTDGRKVALEIVYNFSLKDFEFVGPIYDFSTLSSDIFSSPLLLSNTNESNEFENMVLLKQEEKVFVKVFYNGKYIFVPGNIYKVTQKPTSILGEKYIYPDFGAESSPRQIQ